MKNIEKSLTNFVSGKGQRVSDEALCAFAKKDAKAADEIIDILFNVINKELEAVTGVESLDKVRELLKCITMIMNNSDTVNRRIVARRVHKLDEKIDRLKSENKSKFLDLDNAYNELEKTREEIEKIADDTEEKETKQYDLMDLLTFHIKDIPYIEYTFKKMPSLVNVKDKKAIPIIQTILFKYLKNIKEKDTEDILYYGNLLSLIVSQKSFDLKEKDKRKFLEVLHNEVNNLSIGKKNYKKNKPIIDDLNALIDRIQGNDEKEHKIDDIANKYHIDVFFDATTIENAKLVKEPKVGEMTDREAVEDYVITIDGEHALEIDDGLSCRKLENGNFLLGVHIASVLGYLDYDSDLVQTAISRNRSIYLPKKYQTVEDDFDRVIPIFPYSFSTQTASLLEGKTRLTRSYYFEIDRNGNVIGERFPKTITTNNKKTTYEEVDNILKHGSNDKRLEHTIKNLQTVTVCLEKKYKVTDIYEQVKENIDDFSDLRVKRVGAEKIVYQTMLLTGNRVANMFFEKGWPCLYRVHEVNERNIEKLQAMVDSLNKTYGGAQYKKLYELISGLYPNGWYDLKGSHYGLALDHYLHCTSELRRASDIINEHVLEVCYDKEPTEEELRKLQEEIEKRKTEINSKQSQIDWFVKDYKRSYQKRRH